MRRGHDLVVLEEDVVGGGSAGQTSIAAAATLPLSSALRQSGLVDDAAAGDVDDAHAVPHAAKASA